MVESGKSAGEIVEAGGMVQISDEGAIQQIVDRVLEANPGQVAEYRGGKQKVFGFFMGQVMKETQGKANPKMVNDLLKKALVR